MHPRYGMSLVASKRGQSFVHGHPESLFSPALSNSGRREMACSTDRRTLGDKRSVEMPQQVIVQHLTLPKCRGDHDHDRPAITILCRDISNSLFKFRCLGQPPLAITPPSDRIFSMLLTDFDVVYILT